MSGVSAVVLIKAEVDLVNELAKALVEIRGVAEVFSVAGQYDLVAIVRVNHNDDLAEVISTKMRKLKGIKETQTLIAFRVFSKAEWETGGLNVD
jgi:DNA-binding Lrp family transcriptional regulator